MADQPKDEEKVETHSGQIGAAHKASAVRAAAVANATAVPKEILDERQSRIGERRKPAGPPHTEAVMARVAGEEEPSDVPPTECEE